MRRSSKTTQRQHRAASGRRRRSAGLHALRSEQLEARLALAVSVNLSGPSRLVTAGFGTTTPTTVAGPTSVVAYSDGTDDLFLQKVATTTPTLLISNNSSFNDTSSLFPGDQLLAVPDFTVANFGTLYVTNGTEGTIVNQFSDNYPIFGASTTHHVLSYPIAGSFPGGPMTGSVSYAGNTWTFTLTGGGVFTLTGGPGTGVVPTGAALANAGNNNLDAVLTIDWSAPPNAPGSVAPTVTFTYDPDFNGAIASPAITTDFSVPASSPATSLFTLQPPAGVAVPVGANASVVPGSLSGMLSVGGVPVYFRTSGLTRTLVFSLTPDGTFSSELTSFFPVTSTDPDLRTLTGQIDYAAGVISLSTTSLLGVGAGAGSAPQEVGPVQIVTANCGFAVIPLQPLDATFFPGQTINQEVVVDLLAPGSTANIESPIANASVTATATATLGTGATRDQVQAVQVSGGGSGYSVAPAVTFSAPTLPVPPGTVGSTATGTAILNAAGSVVGVVITNPGSGYSSAPTVTFSVPTGALVGSDVVLNASNINVDAQVSAGERFLVGAEGINDYFYRYSGFDQSFLQFWQARAARTVALPIVVQASATPTIAGGALTGIAVNNPGLGYVRAPLVIVEPPPAGSGGRQAVAQAVWNSITQTVTGFTIIDGGSGYDPADLPVIFIEPPYWQAQAEIVKFNAAVGATNYELYVSDDPGTMVERGTLLVSSTGSLSRNPTPLVELVDTPADTIYIQADSTDVISEGTIFGTTQSYLLRSTLDRDYLAPFLLTTASPRTGVRTGKLRGANVAVTLGNDALTPDRGATAFNTVDIATQIDSFRIKASTALQPPIPGFRPNPGAFPYNLTIDEADDIQFDAVAASGNPISIAAAGSITFTSSVATDSDLSITARPRAAGTPASFTVSAPMTTRFGTISVAADSLLVANTLKVTAAAVDANRDDITLTARGGSIELRNEVSGVNNIRIRQVNGTVVGPTGRPVEQVGGVFGTGRVFGESLDVNSEGKVELRTAVTSLNGVARTGFSVSEADDITIPSLVTGGSISLSAAGADPGPGYANAIALKATVRNLNPLSLSVTDVTAHAPNGSVDVVIDSSNAVAIGKLDNIANGTALSMKAAGNSSIVSYGNLAVHDAPVAGSGARQVRARTTGTLTATYTPRQPGVLPDLLTGVGSINAAATAALFDGVGDLRVGERVLVANGVSTGGANANGIYVVTRVGGGAGANLNWELVRAPDADTQAECPSGTYVAVIEGTQYAGLFYQLTYTTVSPTLAIRVSTTELELPASFATFVPFLTVGQPVQGGGIAAGATIAGITTTPSGITVVTLVAPGGVNPISGTGPVRVTFLVPLLGRTPATAAPVTLSTTLGSPSNLRLTTSLVVSSTGTTNDATGSLGKMIRLRNSFNPLNNEVGFHFDSRIATPILLTQELPAITSSFTVDGRSRWVNGRASLAGAVVAVDGSAIIRTRTERTVAPATVIDGFTVSGPVTAALRNLSIGGFRAGAAVRSVNTNSVPQALSIDGVAMGLTTNGNRLANRFGVVAAGNGVVAVVGSTIGNSEAAGVAATSANSRVTVASSTISTKGSANEVGMKFDAGTHRIGVEKLAANSLPATTVRDSAEITVKLGGTVPADLPNRLFLGQAVSGLGIPANAKILRVITDAATSTVRIVLSVKATRTAPTTALFGVAGRNSVQYNRNGIVLAGGSTTIVSTNINDNALNGIVLVAGSHRIGNTGVGATGKSLTPLSNAIHANGVWGVYFNGANAAAQRIFGNFFGTAYQASVGVPNGRGNVGQPSGAPLAGYVPTYRGTSIVGLDANGNQHTRAVINGRPAPGQPWRR